VPKLGCSDDAAHHSENKGACRQVRENVGKKRKRRTDGLWNRISRAILCYGHAIENWAIFEDWTMPDRFPIHRPNSRKVAEDDPDLLEALRILGLVIGD